MKKYKVGYTAGVYDMFHVGHLNIIMNAKQYCEHLIVAVSTDEVVWQNKHKKPIIKMCIRDSDYLSGRAESDRGYYDYQ